MLCDCGVDDPADLAVTRFGDLADELLFGRDDLADPDLSPLPESVDVVINYAVLPPTHKDAMPRRRFLSSMR